MANPVKQGDTFTTRKGATLGVLQRVGNLWEVVCSVCSKDTELFQEPFLTTSGRLNFGKVPCGCGRPAWKPYQYQVLIERLLENTNWSFVEFLTPQPKSREKVKLNCPLHGDFYLSYNTLSTQKRGCGYCVENKYRKSNGQFKSGVSIHAIPLDLKEQRVKEVISDFPTKTNFIGFCDDPIYVELECITHGKYAVLYNNLIYKKYRCGKCRGKNSGVLYVGIISDNDIDIAIKIGKTNCVERRFSELSRKNPLSIRLLQQFDLGNEICGTLENRIKSQFNIGYLGSKDFPSGFSETLCLSELDSILEYINNFVKEGYKE